MPFGVEGVFCLLGAELVFSTRPDLTGVDAVLRVERRRELAIGV